jgi:PleD family two-component response regulator
MAVFSPHPQILLASPETMPMRELSNALKDSGCRVVTAHDERETLDFAHRRPLHAIILDARIAPPGHGICLTLHSVAFATPLLLLSTGEVTRAELVAALAAGAWDVLGFPLDIEQLLLRLHLYLEPKLELERVSEECLVDRVSGLYNAAGLARRAAELAAIATRTGLTLACAAFRPLEHPRSHAATDRLAQTFKSMGRASDAVGRTGPTEFAIYAHAPNNWAAARLVHRITDTIGGLRSGYTAANGAQRISPPMLLARARSAMEAHRPSA